MGRISRGVWCWTVVQVGKPVKVEAKTTMSLAEVKAVIRRVSWFGGGGAAVPTRKQRW